MKNQPFRECVCLRGRESERTHAFVGVRLEWEGVCVHAAGCVWVRDVRTRGCVCVRVCVRLPRGCMGVLRARGSECVCVC